MPPDLTNTTLWAPPSTIADAPGLLPSGAIELPAGGAPFALAVDADGRLVVVYYSDIDETIEVLRCPDLDCAAGFDIVTLGPAHAALIEGSLEGPIGLEMALRLDGSPIVLVEHGHTPLRNALRVRRCRVQFGDDHRSLLTRSRVRYPTAPPVLGWQGPRSQSPPTGYPGSSTTTATQPGWSSPSAGTPCAHRPPEPR